VQFLILPAVLISTDILANALSDSEASSHPDNIKSSDLPEQALQSGLIEFALQADITIVVDTNLIKASAQALRHAQWVLSKD
jgi:hypothetical protein